MVGNYSYVPDGHGKRRAGDWGKFKEICIGGSMDFWRKRNFLEKMFFKGHLDKFYKNAGHARGHFAKHHNNFKGFMDGNGLLQRNKIAGFASKQWGFGHGDKGFIWWMENNYYNACNAYESRYQGISCQDFVECNFIFDAEAMRRLG